MGPCGRLAPGQGQPTVAKGWTKAAGVGACRCVATAPPPPWRMTSSGYTLARASEIIPGSVGAKTGVDTVGRAPHQPGTAGRPTPGCTPRNPYLRQLSARLARSGTPSPGCTPRGRSCDCRKPSTPGGPATCAGGGGGEGGVGGAGSSDHRWGEKVGGCAAGGDRE